MAKQLSNNMIEREVGDACPRDCPGVLIDRATVGSQGFMECTHCYFSYATRYTPGRQEAGPVELASYIPDSLVRALIEVTHQYDLEVIDPDPKTRAEHEDPDWFVKLKKDTQDGWIKETRAKLQGIWPEICEHFGAPADFAGIDDRKTARALLEEIAIPALRHCEEGYGFDPSARQRIETALNQGGSGR